MKNYTPALLRRFDRLTKDLSSLSQIMRINARCEISAMQKEYGDDVLNAMFEVLKKRDAKKARK